MEPNHIFSLDAYLDQHLGYRDFQASDWPVFAHIICVYGDNITPYTHRLNQQEFEAVVTAAQITLPMVYFDATLFESYPHDICGLFQHFGLDLFHTTMQAANYEITDELHLVITKVAYLLLAITSLHAPNITINQLVNELQQFVHHLHEKGYKFRPEV